MNNAARSKKMGPEHWVVGLHGPRLRDMERLWLRLRPPRGVILFARNLRNAEQVRTLLDDVRQCTGEPTWAAIDEEGGRIHRLPFAPFDTRKTAGEWGERYRREPEQTVQAVYEDALRCGEALRELGFTHNCAPVLDRWHAGAHAVIGDRAYGHDPSQVLTLADACLRGYHDAGIEAIGKHYPGHGLAREDSHHSTPVVEEMADAVLADCEIFRHMVNRGLRHLMTAHVRYPSLTPDVATFSSFWLQSMLRRSLGFTGAIWSDDLCMQGAGDDLRLAMRLAHRAGCDYLLICDPRAVAALYREW